MNKYLGLNNPETYVLTDNRSNTYMVLIFSDLNKAQIYKLPYRNSPHQKIEMVMSFDYLHLFRQNELSEDYQIRKPNDENFLFEIGDKKYIYVGEKVISFETNDKIVKYSLVLMMSNSLMLTEMKTFTLCYIKNRFFFKNMKIQH